jgi:YD repeat-containing protein
MKFIRDNRGRLIGQIIENGNVTYIRDGSGKLKGQHVKSADKTLDEQGRYFGSGEQLLRLLDP